MLKISIIITTTILASAFIQAKGFETNLALEATQASQSQINVKEVLDHHSEEKESTQTHTEPKEPKEQILELAKDFPWPDYLIRLAYCESRFDPNATNHNEGHGVDRGIFQINNKYHPEVSDECAFSITCSTKWTMWRIESGYQHEWACDKYIKNNFDYISKN